MNIIARAALYIYDGSSMAPIFPGKVSKPCDEAAAYLSVVADKIMASDGSRTTCVEPGSAQEEMLRRFAVTPFTVILTFFIIRGASLREDTPVALIKRSSRIDISVFPPADLYLLLYHRKVFL